MLVQLKDANGKIVYVEEEVIMNSMVETGMLFGIPFSAIIEIRKQYLLNRGPMPITKKKFLEVLKI